MPGTDARRAARLTIALDAQLQRQGVATSGDESENGDVFEGTSSSCRSRSGTIVGRSVRSSGVPPRSPLPAPIPVGVRPFVRLPSLRLLGSSFINRANQTNQEPLPLCAQGSGRPAWASAHAPFTLSRAWSSSTAPRQERSAVRPFQRDKVTPGVVRPLASCCAHSLPALCLRRCRGPAAA